MTKGIQTKFLRSDYYGRGHGFIPYGLYYPFLYPPYFGYPWGYPYPWGGGGGGGHNIIIINKKGQKETIYPQKASDK